MKSVTTLILALGLAIMLLAGCGELDAPSTESNPTDTATLASFSDLLLSVSTRSGATNPADFTPIEAAADEAAQVFSDNLGDNVERSRFAEQVDVELQSFAAAYSAAELAATPAEDRAAAVDALLAAVLQSASQAGIDLEQVEIALLAAGAEMESGLAVSLDPVAAELVRLCWDTAAFSLHHRILFELYPRAFETLGASTGDLADLNQTIAVLRDSQIALLRTLEEAVHDQQTIHDRDYYIQQQFNLFAINDLFLFSLGMHLARPIVAPELDPLVGRMQTIPGMSGVTLQQLQDNGIINQNLDPYPPPIDMLQGNGIISQDSGGLPWLSLPDFLVYDWVLPDMGLDYQPLPGLDTELQQLGGSVPAAPVFTPYVNPYLAVFQLKYDADLASLITAAEWNQAGDLVTPAPPTVQELYQWRKNKALRQARVLSGLSGITPAKRQALDTLLFFPL